MYKYLLSTHRGILPHIVDNHIFLSHDLCIYLEDFYYKDSYYYNNGTLSINNFINTSQKIIIKRAHKNILNTRRGLLRINDEEYMKFIAIAKPADHDNPLIEDPVNIENMLQNFKDNKIPTTYFVHSYVDNGYMIKFDGKIIIDNKRECDDLCCVEYSKNYLNHLWNEREISAKTIIALHNYYQIDKIVRCINIDGKLVYNIEVEYDID